MAIPYFPGTADNVRALKRFRLSRGQPPSVDRDERRSLCRRRIDLPGLKTGDRASPSSMVDGNELTRTDDGGERAALTVFSANKASSSPRFVVVRSATRSSPRRAARALAPLSVTSRRRRGRTTSTCSSDRGSGVA